MEKPEPSRRGGHHRTPIEPPVNFPVRTRTSGDILLMEVSDPGIAFPPNGQMTGNLGDGRLVLPPFALGHQSSFVDSSASSNKSMDSSQQQDASCTLTEEQKAHAQPPIWMRVNVELQPRNLPPAMLPPPPFLGGGAMQQQQLMHHQQLMQIHQHQLQQMQHMQHMHEQLQQNQQLQQPLPQQPQQQLVYNPGGYPTTYLSYTIPTLSQQLDWIPSLGMPSPETGLYNIQGLTQPNNSLASTRPGTISPALRMMGPQIQNMPQQGTSSMDGSTFLSTASTAYPPSTLPLTNTIYLTAPIAPDAIPSFIKGQKRKRSESGAKVAEKQQKHLPSIVAMRQSVAQLSVRERLKTLEDTQSCDDTDGYLRVEKIKALTPRYKILKLLGQGTFGKVVEAFDRTTKTRCAIKIIKAIPKYREASKMEIKVLQKISEADPDDEFHCIHLLDFFNYRNHVCIVFELLSLSIFDFLKANKFTPFNISQIRALSRQLIQSVAFIHDELNLIHTDLKPENIMFVSEEYRKASHVKGLLSSSNSELSTAAVLDTRIKLIDFGSAIFEKDHHSSVVCTRHYRAPEIILGIPWSYPCDIWSIGCILIEFFTGIAVFQTHENLEHLAMMQVVLGKVPAGMVLKATGSAQGLFVNGDLNYPNPMVDRKSRKFVKKMKPLRAIVNPKDETTEIFLDLVSKMLRYDPSERIRAAEALSHPFFFLDGGSSHG